MIVVVVVVGVLVVVFLLCFLLVFVFGCCCFYYYIRDWIKGGGWESYGRQNRPFYFACLILQEGLFKFSWQQAWDYKTTLTETPVTGQRLVCSTSSLAILSRVLGQNGQIGSPLWHVRAPH